MPRFQVRETYTNATTNTRFGESDGWIDAYATTRGAVYRCARDEYGAPVSKMYRDVRHTTVAPPASVPPFPAAPSPASERTAETWTVEEIGWVFRKRMVYEDARPTCYSNGKPRYRASDYYMREAWVEVRELPDIEDYDLWLDHHQVVGTWNVATHEVTDEGGVIFSADNVSAAQQMMRRHLDLQPGTSLTIQAQEPCPAG